MKLMLERISRTYRDNEQYEVKVKDYKEAIEQHRLALDRLGGGASDVQYPETGMITLDDDTINYISFNGRVWKGKYWETSVEEVEI